MLKLELPHINVLSKIDLIEKYGKLAYDLEYFTDVQNLNYLNTQLDSEPGGEKFAKLNKIICGIIEDFSLVSFTTLNIQDGESVYDLVKKIDKSNGYVYGALAIGNEKIMEVAARDSEHYTVSDVQEKYMEGEDGDTQEEFKHYTDDWMDKL